MRWRTHIPGLGAPSLLVISCLLFLNTAPTSASECTLVGKGGCRGAGWSEGQWPVPVGKQTLDDCCDICAQKEGCTGLSLSKGGDCLLYGHKKLQPASALGGECYAVQKSEKPIPAKKAEEKAPPAPVKEEKKKESKPEPSKKDLKKKDDDDDDDDDDKKKEKPKDSKKPKEDKPVNAPQQAEKPKAEPRPTEAPKPALKAVKETAKPAEAAKPKTKKPKISEPAKVGDKFIVSVGEGGCRGGGWNKAPFPVDAGRKTVEQCSKTCLENSCTAFHILHEEDGKFDCFLFGHKDVLAVKMLGGKCMTLSATPSGSVEEEEDDEEENEVKGKVHMAHLGKGSCRGAGWTFKKWPVIKGFLSAQGCADACARKKGCTAFDLSEKQPDLTFDCTLYGHKKVAPASGVPGNCYVLSDKPGVVPGDVGAAAAAEEEKEVELEVKGDVDFHMLGKGRCRGPGWSSKKFPAIKGNLAPKDCAIACAKRKGCTAFDIGVMAEGEEECAIYGHKAVASASGVPGTCYQLGKSTAAVEAAEEEAEEEEVDDGKQHKYQHLGKGMCRGANWQGKRWPAIRGIRTLQECANSCGRKKGCTAFDISSPQGNKFDCMLYGHQHPVPAPGVPGECYSLVGGKFIGGEPAKAAEPEARSRAKILNEADQDFINIKDVELLGKGACRGQGWQSGKWPLTQGRKTLKDCAESCKKTKGCVAFDLSNKEQEKYDCLLLGHRDVLPASGLAAKCFIIKGAVSDPATLISTATPAGARKAASSKYPASGFGYAQLGSGLCRGEGWQSAGWPVDKGSKSMKDCAESCSKTKGCRAFDLSSQPESKLFSCLLFSHKNIVPASALSLDGACYVASSEDGSSAAYEAESSQEEEEDIIIDIEGDIDVALLGKGGCRGGGWQEAGWPKVKGYVSVDACGSMCVSTKGCTAFHTAFPKEGSKNEFECFLFGHKSIIPASGLPGNCYTVASGSSRVIKSKPSRPAKAKKEKKYKIPEFEEPVVVEDDFEEDDDEWLFDPPPPEVRSREHIGQILGLNAQTNQELHKITEGTLKDLKKVYESSIKDLEKTYKYRELSNRHFGDPEIFNKPLVVFMGPWSGGKSTIINYLLGTEYTKNAFRSTAEPSPGFNFNLAMYGDHEEEVDGTELSAEWAFSSLQKFGQEFLKKLKGKRLPNKLLEKVTFAEIPGVLETGTIRKIDRRYPFNDACQWFIDHADLIVLVYDYAKLDIGPETEALLDQLKGREQQVRILLNKADEITAEELLKIQGNLVWNVSPLMASAEPPTLYAGSFWSRPYKAGAPKRLLKSQEQSLLKDIRDAIDRRVENRIATARRFAVRVRNHAKMVDCYLTTFKNNKGFLGDKKKVAQDIIDNPGKYHIYEGLSTLTNISRYDLPDPDSYRDFFNIHALTEFETLQSTCTFFKGCPLNKLDIAIAYEFPDILSNYKKKVNLALNPPKVTIKEQKPQKSVKK